MYIYLQSGTLVRISFNKIECHVRISLNNLDGIRFMCMRLKIEEKNKRLLLYTWNYHSLMYRNIVYIYISIQRNLDIFTHHSVYRMKKYRYLFPLYDTSFYNF